jgi:hypothetical protein
LLFCSEKEQRANADRMVRIGENRRRGAACADFFEHLAVLHLGKAAATDLFRRSHAEHADAPEAVDHVPGNICLAIDLLGIEVFIEKRAQLRDGIIDLGLLRIGKPGVGHGPVGHEISEE